MKLHGIEFRDFEEVGQGWRLGRSWSHRGGGVNRFASRRVIEIGMNAPGGSYGTQKDSRVLQHQVGYRFRISRTEFHKELREAEATWESQQSVDMESDSIVHCKGKGAGKLR